MHSELLAQVAGRDGCDNLDDPAYLVCEVRRHDIHGVGQVLPGTCHPGDLGLSSEFTLSADFARHASDFRGKGVELIDHRVNGVLQLKDFAFDIDRDFSRQIAARHCGGYLGDVSHLGGQVRAHGIDRISKIFPCSRNAGDDGLNAEPSFRPDFPCHAGDLGSERSQLFDHGVDRSL